MRNPFKQQKYLTKEEYSKINFNMEQLQLEINKLKLYIYIIENVKPKRF